MSPSERGCITERVSRKRLMLAILLFTVGVACMLWTAVLWEMAGDGPGEEYEPIQVVQMTPHRPTTSPVDQPDSWVTRPRYPTNPLVTHEPEFGPSDLVDPVSKAEAEIGHLPQGSPGGASPIDPAVDPRGAGAGGAVGSGPAEGPVPGAEPVDPEFPLGDEVPELRQLRVLSQLESAQQFYRTTDPAGMLSSRMDSDNDGWNNFRELLEGTNPLDPNTDGDFYPLDSTDPNPLIPDNRGETSVGGIGSGDGGGQGSGQVDPPPTSGWGPNDPGPRGDSYGDDPDVTREVEESDIVKLVGDTLYILNPYRGLIIVDLADIDGPEVLSTFPVLGNPVDMYVVDGMAYLMVCCDYGYWYRYYSHQGDDLWRGRETGNQRDRLQIGGGYDYQIGSKLYIVDVEDTGSPRLLMEFPIEGFVTESRRVGDVIYYVSSCRSWYNEREGTEMPDMTFITSINVADIRDISMIDRTGFDGASVQIHASGRCLYVAEYVKDVVRWSQDGYTNITAVDISDPSGRVLPMDRFRVDGEVWDKYQMDEYQQTLRVVSHLRWTEDVSKVTIFDVSDLGRVREMGSLKIPDGGDLMATRFAEDRAYTIHLPRPVWSYDPLDVIDLSDPWEPELCDVLEFPGWVSHIEVRGDRLITLGVDDTDGDWNVHVSLFDVSDPYNAVMRDRVRVGGEFASSAAHDDPKALTVVDEEGLVLVPCDSWVETGDGWKLVSTVRVVSFDLVACDLSVRGSFEQPDTVLRTRYVDERVLSTSTDYLVVADVSDVDIPLVTASVRLSTRVVDLHTWEDRACMVYMPTGDEGTCLKVARRGTPDIGPSIWEARMDDGLETWFWDGRLVHTVSREIVVDTGRVFVTVKTYDVAGDAPEPVEVQRFNAGLAVLYCEHFKSWVWKDHKSWGDGPDALWYPAVGDLGNPVMLEGGVIAIYIGEKLYLTGVGPHRAYQGTFSLRVECWNFYGLLPAGRDVLLISATPQVETFDGLSKTMTCFKVIRVRTQDLGTQRVGRMVRVPGLPLGCSEDGSLLYTASTWYLPDTAQPRTVLSVVRLGDEAASVLWAVDVTDLDVAVSGDRALVALPLDLSSEGRPRTLLYVLDLAGQRIEWTQVVDGMTAILTAEDGVAILKRDGEAGLLLVDLLAPSSTGVVPVSAQSTGNGLHRSGPVLHLVQGRHGIVEVDLDLLRR